MDTGGGSADQFMDVRYGGDDPQSYTAGVPIPGRQQSWAAPEFTQMRDPCSVDELGTSAGGGSFQSPPPSSSIGAGGPFDFANTGSPSPLTPGAVFKPASQEPELSRNLQSIQIDDIFEGVDVCSLLSAPTFSGLHANDDLSDLQLVDATFDGRPLIIKSEEVSSPADWTPSFDADAPFSSSFPRALPPSASSALVGHHDPLLSGSYQSSTPAHRAGPTLQSLLSRPPLGTAASCSPARAESRQLHQLQMLHQQSPSAAARLSSSVPADASLSAAHAAGRLLPPLTTASRMDEARGSGSSISTGGILSPGSLESYLDDGGDSHDESDSDSDAGSVDDERQLSASLGSRKDRYFWQYNVQSKGPKGQRIQLTPELANPRRVQPPIDPVFSSQFQVQGIKHSGKARRGDGNDLTPSPRKLLSIRRDLDKLNHLITDLTPPSELPFNVRPKSRKEKNKLASRACRLKKKAQHEAYKIQLAGLSDEHKRLSSGLSEMVQLVRARLSTTGSSLCPEETSQRLDRVWRLANKHRVAGQLPDYVQRVLDRMETGSTPAIGGAVGGDFPMTLEPG